MKKILLLLFLLLPIAYPLYPAFKENIWPARASAMGGAFCAVSNDVSAMIFNPAGLSQIERREANFGYTQKFMGLPNVTVGNMAVMFGYPFEKIGTFGISYLSSDVSSLYAEQTLALSYSAPIHKMLGTKTVKVGKRSMEFPNMTLPVYAGLNLKMLSIKYNTAGDERAAKDPVFADAQVSGGLAADLGFLVKPTEKLSSSLVVKNLLSPNLAIGKDSAGAAASEPAPMEIGVGAAYRFGDFGAFEDFVAALDIANRMPKDAAAEMNWRLGAESWFAYHRYAARIGFNNTELALGGGLIQTVGSVEIQLDYSFALPLSVSDNSGHHRLSVTTRF
ncbi:MAG: hypothetical protein QME32_02940 [Endomicrobiia bacterium]|nr:hypothetical protein [Endomicrobiia bacterium]